MVVAVLLLVLNINARGGMTFTFNELLATPRGIQELMNDRGHNHQILVHINGVRTYVRVASAPPNRARIQQDFAVVEQQDANTFIVHAIDKPDQLYQVSSRPEVEHQILSERITGKVGRKITTKIESVTWAEGRV